MLYVIVHYKYIIHTLQLTHAGDQYNCGKDDIVDKVNGEIIVEDIYDINETDDIDDKTDEILVNHDEVLEEMSVEEIIKFYEDEKNLFTSEYLDYYCDIKQVECAQLAARWLLPGVKENSMVLCNKR